MTDFQKILILDSDKHLTLDVSEREHAELTILQFSHTNYTTNITVNLVGENASVKIRGLALANDGQSIENTVQVNHIAPNCTSDVLYKYVLKDSGTVTNWVGNVTIQAGAKGTKTYEENRNLVLTKGAKALSEPNLEILEGDIESAGHASATGRFDDEQLFYLQSRGISEVEAKKLIVEGFLIGELREVLGVVENGTTENDTNSELYQQILGQIDEKMQVKIQERIL